MAVLFALLVFFVQIGARHSLSNRTIPSLSDPSPFLLLLDMYPNAVLFKVLLNLLIAIMG